MSAGACPLVVGIDLGGTKIRAGVAAMDGAVLHEAVEPTRGGRDLLLQLVQLVERLELAAGGRVVVAAIGGAGVPDDADGSFSLAPNISGLDGVGLVGELETRLGHRVVIENDVNIAALGELSDGVGRGEPSFAFVAVGTGIGVGLVLDGRLWRGAAGGAGEVGYLPIGADPLDPVNQRRGALEERLAGDALARRYADAAGETGPVTAHEVFERAAADDPAALAALDEEARWLAYALVSLDAVVDPGLFVLGGGIGGRVELLAPLRAWLGRLGRASLRVRLSALGSSAPVLGAIRLAIDTIANSTEREAS